MKFFLKTHKPSDVLTILAVQNPIQSEISESSKAAEASNVSGTLEVAGIAAVSELAVVKVGGRDRNFPLAADIRGASEKENSEEAEEGWLFENCSTVLSVPYDGLVQRYLKYKTQKENHNGGGMPVSGSCFHSLCALSVLSDCIAGNHRPEGIKHKICVCRLWISMTEEIKRPPLILHCR